MKRSAVVVLAGALTANADLNSSITQAIGGSANFFTGTGATAGPAPPGLSNSVPNIINLQSQHLAIAAANPTGVLGDHIVGAATIPGLLNSQVTSASGDIQAAINNPTGALTGAATNLANAPAAVVQGATLSTTDLISAVQNPAGVASAYTTALSNAATNNAAALHNGVSLAHNYAHNPTQLVTDTNTLVTRSVDAGAAGLTGSGALLGNVATQTGAVVQTGVNAVPSYVTQVGNVVSNPVGAATGATTTATGIFTGGINSLSSSAQDFINAVRNAFSAPAKTAQTMAIGQVFTGTDGSEINVIDTNALATAAIISVGGTVPEGGVVGAGSAGPGSIPLNVPSIPASLYDGSVGSSSSSVPSGPSGPSRGMPSVPSAGPSMPSGPSPSGPSPSGPSPSMPSGTPSGVPSGPSSSGPSPSGPSPSMPSGAPSSVPTAPTAIPNAVNANVPLPNVDGLF